MADHILTGVGVAVAITRVFWSWRGAMEPCLVGETRAGYDDPFLWGSFAPRPHLQTFLECGSGGFVQDNSGRHLGEAGTATKQISSEWRGLESCKADARTMKNLQAQSASFMLSFSEAFSVLVPP